VPLLGTSSTNTADENLRDAAVADGEDFGEGATSIRDRVRKNRISSRSQTMPTVCTSSGEALALVSQRLPGRSSVIDPRRVDPQVPHSGR
jgi:hypothetical protein